MLAQPYALRYTKGNAALIRLQSEATDAPGGDRGRRRKDLIEI